MCAGMKIGENGGQTGWPGQLGGGDVKVTAEEERLIAVGVWVWGGKEDAMGREGPRVGYSGGRLDSTR